MLKWGPIPMYASLRVTKAATCRILDGVRLCRSRPYYYKSERRTRYDGTPNPWYYDATKATMYPSASMGDAGSSSTRIPLTLSLSLFGHKEGGKEATTNCVRGRKGAQG
jgi:hypothetical protein